MIKRETRLKNQAVREKKKGIVMKDKSKQLMGINVYITNTSRKEVPTTLCALVVFVTLAD